MPSDSSVSYAFVDADGEPLDVSAWTRANIWMAGVPAMALLASVVPDDLRSKAGALGLGFVATLLVASASRVWTLVHDARHRQAPRAWWVAHQARALRRMTLGAAVALVLFVVCGLLSLVSGVTYVAALLVGPTVGSVAVLTLVAEVARLRRGAAQRPWPAKPRISR